MVGDSSAHGVLGPPGTFCALVVWISPKAALQKCPSTSGDKFFFLSRGFPRKKRWGGCTLLGMGPGAVSDVRPPQSAAA